MLYDTLLKRRSIRSFQNRRVEPEKIATLAKAALLSPSSRNIRPWAFVVVDDADKISRLARAKPHGASFLESAPLAIAVIAKTAESDVWVEDTAIASTILLLMADALGLGACWCQIRRRPHTEAVSAESYVRDVLGIPETYAVASIVGIGYAASPLPAYDDTKLAFEKLFYNRFADPFEIKP